MLDFTLQPKTTLPVKLPDGTQLSLCLPRKELFARLARVQDALSASEEPEAVYNELLAVAADILSNNRENKTITIADVNDALDISDIALLIREFATFAGQAAKDPN